MLFAVASLVVLLFLGREELNLRVIVAIVAFFILFGIAIKLLGFHPIIFIVSVVAVDIFLILKIFGSDLSVR